MLALKTNRAEIIDIPIDSICLNQFDVCVPILFICLNARFQFIYLLLVVFIIAGIGIIGFF